MAEYTRPALGQEVPLGTLYDARLDQFLSGPSLPRNPPRCSILETPCPNAIQNEISVSLGASRAARFQGMGVDDNLAASVLSGLVEPKGSATFLNDGTLDKEFLYGAVHHVYNTCEERLNLCEPRFPDAAHVGDSRSTHVVVGIKWGIQNIMTMKLCITNPSERTALEASFHRDMVEFTDIARSLPSLNFNDNSASNRLKQKYELKLYTDRQRDGGIPKGTLSIMCRFVQLGPEHIRGHDGKRHAISYTLLPIHILRQLLSGTVPVPNSILGFRPVVQTHLFMELFDEFNDGEEKLDEYRHFLQGKKQYVSRAHIDHLKYTITSLKTAHESMKASFSKAVASIRGGTAGENCLQELLGGFTPVSFTSFVNEQTDKINFIDEAVGSGATYIGFNGLSPDSVTLAHPEPPPYAFHFNNYVVRSSRSWADQRVSLLEFLWVPDRRSQVYLVDFDAFPAYGHLQSAQLIQMQRHNAQMAQPTEPRETSIPVKPAPRDEAAPCATRKCIAQYDENALHTFNTAKPTWRQLVKIPCPGRYCGSRLNCVWTCAICDIPIKFAFTQEYIYCHCGRAFFNKWRFKCNDEDHGQSFVRYRSRDLRRLLTRMDREIYRNILVLGETGVGKSTFINAFHNYLVFESFENAKEASEHNLEFSVPCSFSVNYPDPSTPYGEFKLGVKAMILNEMVTMATLRRRKRIGDTRGPEQDKINMRGILDALVKYQEVHGILILLKTDQSRLTATFTFCFEELLSHIHRSAVANIAFGFTHARNSNYIPGESLVPLNRLLTEHTDVNFTLNPSTAYCFDAESFRYLAAHHQGVKVGDDTVYHESWDKSREATLSFLDHIDSLKPHDVNQMLGMDEVRQVISQLIIPMVDVSQEIAKNLDVLKEKVKELKDTQLTGDELRERLHIERIKLDSKKLDKPRTVCTHPSCCDLKRDVDGEVVTLYRTICHEDCRLPGVTGDCVGDRGLIDCRAFKHDPDRSCSTCRHPWRQHMHSFYILKEVRVQIKDKEIERRLKQNMSDVALRKQVICNIQQYQEEYQHERNQLRKATARFVTYLKENAILPINDATEKYYNQLIKNEEDKIQLGKERKYNVDKNKKKLKSLEHDRRKYLELIDTIKNNKHIPRGSGEELLTREDISEQIIELYNLKHFGSSLKNLKEVITSSKRDAHREDLPFRRRSSSLNAENGSSGSDEGIGGKEKSVRQTTSQGFSNWFSRLSRQSSGRGQ
ncbi:uncharacterized protein QYS62_008838 [Fusarium acuminatum]|uniref:G domain-containing protein n=1 Tax=Fusarium acuminatum TaxID=5515 RepID=A0ABZ2X5A6_9HYPO